MKRGTSSCCDWLLNNTPSPFSSSLAEKSVPVYVLDAGLGDFEPVDVFTHLSGSFYKYVGFETVINYLKAFCLCVIWFLVHYNSRLTDMITDRKKLFVCMCMCGLGESDITVLSNTQASHV